MGVIRAGILSTVSGKVAGVVGGKWKDKSYLREWVRPANPNTTPQQVQRGKMSVGVAFAKALTGQVFNKYTDKFERSMTGFNRFIKDNMALFLSPITYASVKMTNGKLWGIPTASISCSALTATISWTPSDLGNNGSATDMIYSVGYDETTGLWYFQTTEKARSLGASAIHVPASAVGHTLAVYAWTAKYSSTSPTLLEMISNSMYLTVVVS